MKLTIRVFALAVVAAGLVASFHNQQALTIAANSHQVIPSAYPIPMCPPDGKTPCGIRQ